MMRRAIVGTFMITCMGTISQEAAAQPRPNFSVDATLGHVYGYTSGEYRNDRQGSAFDMVLGLRPGGRGIVLGANGSFHGGGPDTSECIAAVTTEGCVQSFPFFGVAGALVGWENASATLRALGGPAYVYDDFSALAWQARLDGSLPVVWRLAFAGSVRGTVVPNYRGHAVTLLAFGLGVRVR